MEHITTRIGKALASELSSSLKTPMSWPLIDALAKLEEAEEESARRNQSVPEPADKS